jgi:hypothetical protein
MQTAERSFILAVDNFAGRDDAVIKALDDFRPRGVAGVTTLSNGQIVLILDMKELLVDLTANVERDLRSARRRGCWNFSPRPAEGTPCTGPAAPVCFCSSATTVARATIRESV